MSFVAHSCLFAVFWHDGAGFDPGGDDGDVGVGEFAAWGHGHGIVCGAFVADELDEEGVFGVSGDEDGAVVAAFEHAGHVVEAEAAAMVGRAVAAVAVVAENGLDLLRVVRLGVRRGVRLRSDGGGVRQRGDGEGPGKSER